MSSKESSPSNSKQKNAQLTHHPNRLHSLNAPFELLRPALRYQEPLPLELAQPRQRLNIREVMQSADLTQLKK